MPNRVLNSDPGEERIVVGTDGSPCASRAVDFAAHEAALGTRGHNQVAGLFVGSVSDYVLHHASCTTIVVR